MLLSHTALFDSYRSLERPRFARPISCAALQPQQSFRLACWERARRHILRRGRGGALPCSGPGGGCRPALPAMGPSLRSLRPTALRPGNRPGAPAVAPGRAAYPAWAASGAGTAHVVLSPRPRGGVAGRPETQATERRAPRPPKASRLAPQAPTDCAAPCPSASSDAFSSPPCCW